MTKKKPMPGNLFGSTIQYEQHDYFTILIFLFTIHSPFYIFVYHYLFLIIFYRRVYVFFDDRLVLYICMKLFSASPILNKLHNSVAISFNRNVYRLFEIVVTSMLIAMSNLIIWINNLSLFEELHTATDNIIFYESLLSSCSFYCL